MFLHVAKTDGMKGLYRGVSALSVLFYHQPLSLPAFSSQPRYFVSSLIARPDLVFTRSSKAGLQVQMEIHPYRRSLPWRVRLVSSVA